MKTISLASILVALLATACNSGSESAQSEDSSSTNITNVENVNGNIPDTSNSITLGSDSTNLKDSTVADSTRR